MRCNACVEELISLVPGAAETVVHGAEVFEIGPRIDRIQSFQIADCEICPSSEKETALNVSTSDQRADLCPGTRDSVVAIMIGQCLAMMMKPFRSR